MSDNANETEQQLQMEEIFICADVWHGVFAFLDPFEVGLKMALISDRLDVLVDVHFKSRKWSLRWMEICRMDDKNGVQILSFRTGELLPIPQGPIPSKVVGFEGIEIFYVDQPVIEFLQRFRRLFDSSSTNVDIYTNKNNSRNREIIRQKILPLVNDNICRFLSYSPTQLDCLRQISPAILRNWANLRSIDSFDLFPEFPAEDNAEASSGQAVAKWLLTPRGDGLPKVLRCRSLSAKIEGLKRSFVSAFEPANFIIRLRSPVYGLEPFELKNNWTGERLTLRRINEDYWLLVRCPIGREEDKWTNWEEEAIDWYWYPPWNCISINFNDSNIGDDMDQWT